MMANTEHRRLTGHWCSVPSQFDKPQVIGTLNAIETGGRRE